MKANYFFPKVNLDGLINAMIEVYVFSMGYIGQVNLEKIAQLTNKSQKVIHITVGDPVPYPFTGYKTTDGFLDLRSWLLGKFREVPNATLRTGITLARISSNPAQRIAGNNTQIISTADIEEVCAKSNRGQEDYLLIEILTEVLWIQFKENNSSSTPSDFYHSDIRGCILDKIDNSEDQIIRLRTCKIDRASKIDLIKANVPENVICAVEVILDKINQVTFGKSLQDTLRQPLFSFFLGGIIVNIISSLLYESFGRTNNIYILGILISAVALLVISNYFISNLKTNKK